MSVVMAAILLGAAQAEPPNPNIACIVERIPDSVRASALNEAVTGQGGAVQEAFRQATDACARERSWSQYFASGMGRIAAALVIAEEAAARLQREGILPDLIHDWFDAQPAAIQQNADAGQDASALLVSQLQADGVAPARLDANASTIGLMLGALQMLERIGAGLE
jgi:hypothetical protein